MCIMILPTPTYRDVYKLSRVVGRPLQQDRIGAVSVAVLCRFFCGSNKRDMSTIYCPYAVWKTQILNSFHDLKRKKTRSTFSANILVYRCGRGVDGLGEESWCTGSQALTKGKRGLWKEGLRPVFGEDRPLFPLAAGGELSGSSSLACSLRWLNRPSKVLRVEALH